MRIFEVGGSVRDRILGLKNKDLDYAIEAVSYQEMKDYIGQNGQIFLEKPEFATIRAKIGKEVSDFVLCRKDGYYSDGRRPDEVYPGTILDDLARRDFTMNAIAIDISNGAIYDPFGGIQDINSGVIRCVGNTNDRMYEDGLRLLRALRFSITKEMIISSEIRDLFEDIKMIEFLIRSVSEDRIREELFKMFECDTFNSMMILSQYPVLTHSIFSGRIWLKPTNEKR